MADISVTPSSVKPANARTRIEEGIAGAAITAGQAIYADASDSNKLKPALSTNQTQANSVVGIALNDVATDQPLDYAARGDVTFNSALTAGTVYVLGGASGGISPSADLTGSRYGTILGVSTSATNLRVGIVTSGVNAVGGGAWTPASLGNLWAWYKSDSGVWQDTSGTSAATNSTNAARWDDQSGNGRHLTQATSGLRPVFNTNVLNGLAALTFTNDWLRASVSNAPSTDYSLFIVMKIAQQQDEIFVDCGKYQYSGGGNNLYVGHTTWGSCASYYNGSLSETGSGWRLHSVTVDDQSGTWAGTLYLDGTQKNTNTSSIMNQDVTQTVTVGGSRDSDVLVPDMQVVEVIVMNALANGTDRQNVNDYIETRYGLTIA
jgi:hypothetical protein